MKHIILSLSILFGIAISASAENTKLLRFPDIHDNQIVFSYAGDLYVSTTDGGTARKITNHEGYEMFPKFSPDGSQIAFTAQYDGNTEVYLIPAKGGAPKRLSFTATLDRDDISDRMGPNNIVMGWTPDGKYVIIRSRMISYNSFVGQLFKIPVDGGMHEQLPLPRGSWCSLNEDGSAMVYNRVFREFRTWKYYKGGMADDIWLHNFEDHSTTRLFKNNTQDIQPMWIGEKVCFISDRDRTMNLFAYDFTTKTVEKLTDFTDYDIKFPGFDNQHIIFERAGELHTYNIASGEVKTINIQIQEDFNNRRTAYKDASENIRTVSVSPDGKRVTVGARGEIFSLPAKEGITYRLTESSGAHDRNPQWSPDGKNIAFWSDMSGEFELYLQDKDGKNPPIQLTENQDTYPYAFQWSPDSKKIAWSDKKLRLRYINVESKAITEVHKSKLSELRDFTWSPDNKWIAFSDDEENRMSRIYLYNLADKSKTAVTDQWYNSHSPAFGTNGKALFFASKRDFNPIYSETEWNHAYRDMHRIYYVTLSKDAKDPLAPENDEVDVKSNEENGDKENKTEETEADKTLKIDLDGISERLGVLPVPAASYYGLASADGKLYFNQYQFRKKSEFKCFDFKKKEVVDLEESVGYELAANKKHMLIRKGGKYYVIDLPSGKLNLENAIDMSNMKIWVNLQEEWAQIYNEAWRQMRDFFYDPNMHGLNWKAMNEKYAALLPYVNHRNDLTYLIGELIGELNVGHAYINGGDREQLDKIYTGLLGAQFEKDKSGYFKITKILNGQNWNKAYVSPLTRIGMDVEAGDYIVAINGKSTKDADNLHELLLGKAGQKLFVSVNSKASEKDAETYIVEPIKNEEKLYYHKWVQGNIDKVTKATNGRVGYIHIPDMGPEGLNEFVKYFYPQLSKEALIIDDRGNGGGNVSPMLIERLRRELSMWGQSRNVDIPGTRPRGMHVGPKVLLVNQYSASDGDLFPYQFRKHNLGKIIGVRTWGGVVGIRGSLPFIDGADMRKPEFAHFAADGSKFIIEGHGVEPDIEVINDPWKEFNGEDEQLNKAIEVILKELEENPVKVPDTPDFPNKAE
jgi:tricorn protease